MASLFGSPSCAAPRRKLAERGARPRARLCSQQRACASAAAQAAAQAPSEPEAWRRARPIAPGSAYPAKELCSGCGLCDTHYVGLVRQACAFLGDGQGRQPALEAAAHGRPRDAACADERAFGVHEALLRVRAASPVAGAQQTGVVTTLALAALRTGLVEAVALVGSQPGDPLRPRPFLALTEEDVLSARGVKPCLSPSLNVLAEVEARGLRRLLFVGVGCAVQALRSVEPHLGLEALYVVGTNCTDNGTSAGLGTFLAAVSDDPATVTGYEFWQDYRVHIKHGGDDGPTERVPYFSLPAAELAHVIAPSCLSCFDYTNALADLVVGYMGAPDEGHGVPMGRHGQYMTVRNVRGRRLLEAAGAALVTQPAASSGDRRPLVLQTLLADDGAALAAAAAAPGAGAGAPQAQQPMPRWLGHGLASLLTALGPRGLEFARYSIEYHTLRNALRVARAMPPGRAAAHLPPFAKAIVADYDAGGAVSARLALTPGRSGGVLPGGAGEPAGEPAGAAALPQPLVLAVAAAAAVALCAAAALRAG